MGRVASNRKTAAALRKTLQQLEADPSLNPQDPSFVNLKCSLLQRISDKELDKSPNPASIHVLDPPASEPSASVETATEDHTHIV